MPSWSKVDMVVLAASFSRRGITISRGLTMSSASTTLLLFHAASFVKRGAVSSQSWCTFIGKDFFDLLPVPNPNAANSSISIIPKSVLSFK